MISSIFEDIFNAQKSWNLRFTVNAHKIVANYPHLAWSDQPVFPEIPKLPRWWEFPNFSRYKFADENDNHLGKLFKIRFLKIIFSDNIYTSFRYLYMVFGKKTWIKKLRSSQVRMLNFFKLADKQWLNRKEKKGWF